MEGGREGEREREIKRERRTEQETERETEPQPPVNMHASPQQTSLFWETSATALRGTTGIPKSY